MTNNQFEFAENPTNRFDNKAINSSLSLQALELMAQQSPNASDRGESARLDFLNCDENPFRKGCEGPGKNPFQQPEDDEKRQPEKDTQNQPNGERPQVDGGAVGPELPEDHKEVICPPIDPHFSRNPAYSHCPQIDPLWGKGKGKGEGKGEHPKDTDVRKRPPVDAAWGKRR